MKELDINTTSNTNSTYIPCTDSFDEILKTHANFINSVDMEMSEEDKALPYLYWTRKLAPVNVQLNAYHAFLQGFFPPLKMN